MIGWILALALLANAAATVFHALELRQARLRRRPTAAPGTVVGPTPAPRVAPDGVDEQRWLKSQKVKVRARLQREFPKLSGKALEDAVDQILAQGRATLARLK